MSNVLISADELCNQLEDPELIIFDASWHMPNAKRDAYKEFQQQHIPGAQFFDIDVLSDKNSNLPHMLPNSIYFESKMQELGVNQESKIIVYDTVGLFSAARAWWMLRIFRHTHVSILDGGLPAWMEKQSLTNTEVKIPIKGNFKAAFDQDMVINKVDLANQSDELQILDARSTARFKGEAPEPRKGLRSGHIPGSINLPYGKLLNANGIFHTKDILKTTFEVLGIQKDKPIVTTCGSGVTACIIAAGLEITGYSNYRIYDGSWAEWGADESLPITC